MSATPDDAAPGGGPEAGAPVPGPPDPAAAEIRAVFERTVALGYRRDRSEGATPEQIRQFVAEQDVPSAPAAVHEVFRLIGHRPGLWLAGSHFGVHRGGRDKTEAASLLVHTETGPAGALVLVGHGGYEYQFVPGAFANEPNPPVWLVREADDDEEGEAVVVRTWPSVVAWFRFQSDEVLAFRETCAGRSGPDQVRRYFSR